VETSAAARRSSEMLRVRRRAIPSTESTAGSPASAASTLVPTLRRRR
jgi:hypothetical protein